MVPALAVLVLALTPPSAIKGGTPEQRAAVKAILDRLPDCITAPGGVPVAVEITNRNVIGAAYEHQDRTLRIDASMLDPARFPAASTAFRQDQCTPARDIAWMQSDTRRVLVHELAHAYQHEGTTGRRRVSERMDGFFGIRFENEYEIWSNDAERDRLETELNGLLGDAARRREARQPVPRETLARICELQAELSGMYSETGLPARFTHDRHAVKKPEIDPATGKPRKAGAEFFAIAVESLTSAHGIYCSVYEPEERAWLESELGDCLGALPGKAGCWNGNGDPSNNGWNRAGMRR